MVGLKVMGGYAYRISLEMRGGGGGGGGWYEGRSGMRVGVV